MSTRIFVRRRQFAMIKTTDKLKIFILGLVLSICAFTAVKKFILVSPQTIRIEPDFSVCNINVSNNGTHNNKITLDDCKEKVRGMNYKLNAVCKPYMDRLSNCQNKRYNSCRSDKNNLEGCIYSITKSFIQDYSA